MCLKWHFAIRRSRSDCLPPASILGGANATVVGNGVSLATGQQDHHHAVVDHHLAGKTSISGTSTDNTYSSLTQLAAWGVPAIQTVTVLVARLVDADELLGKRSSLHHCYIIARVSIIQNATKRKKSTRLQLIQ